jgi:hypothetical protein
VEIHDLLFDLAVMAAIQIWKTCHVRINGNTFEGSSLQPAP